MSELDGSRWVKAPCVRPFGLTVARVYTLGRIYNILSNKWNTWWSLHHYTMNNEKQGDHNMIMSWTTATMPRNLDAIMVWSWRCFCSQVRLLKKSSSKNLYLQIRLLADEFYLWPQQAFLSAPLLQCKNKNILRLRYIKTKQLVSLQNQEAQSHCDILGQGSTEMIDWTYNNWF